MVTDDFAEAWNSKDYEGLSSFAEDGKQAKYLKLFSGLAERYGWGDDWPEISGMAPDQGGSSTKIYFETEAGYLPIRFKKSGSDAWRIRSITLTEIKQWRE